MNLDDMIITAFCEIDDATQRCLQYWPGQRLRARGPRPVLQESEVLCMEVIGAYLGFHQDKALFDFFRHHYSHFFPALKHLHRTTFVRQAANLWRFKEQMWQYWLNSTPHQSSLSFLDSVPLPVCRGGRATFCRRFRYASVEGLQATFGFDHAARQTFWGFRLHVHVAWPGLITRFVLAPAHVQELKVAPQLLQAKAGVALGDRNYWSPLLREELRQEAPDLCFLSPYKKKDRDPTPQHSRFMARLRFRIECVLSQWCGRFALKAVSARDVWHLSSRLLREVLCHTLCVRLNWKLQQSPLKLAQLID